MKPFTPIAEDTNWIERLRPGHMIYLCKERCHGRVELPCFPPEPGSTCSKLAFMYPGGRISIWFVSNSGKGMDGSQLILPVEGNLPDFPEPIEWPTLIELRRQIAALQSDVDQLKKGRSYENYL